jgi:hypothetical protein
MDSCSLSQEVLARVQRVVNVPTSQTLYMERWDRPGQLPVGLERRGTRFVRLWLPSLIAAENINLPADFYSPSRGRNSNLPEALKLGRPIVCAMVTRRNLGAACHLLEQMRDLWVARPRHEEAA